MPKDYKQYDSRWNTQAYAGENINNSGCGPTSCADLLEQLPSVTAAWMQANGCASDGFGTYWEGIPKCIKAFGKDCSQLNYSSLYGQTESSVFTKWKQRIQSGYCGILLMGRGMWTGSGHYIAIVDYKDDKYLVYDPASEPRTGWHPWSDFESVIKILYTTNIPSISGASKQYAYHFNMPVLMKGSKGKEVTLFERIGKAYGCYKSTIDESFGDGCVEATKMIQILHNLTKDGICGNGTFRALTGLYSDGNTYYVKLLQKGSKGESVKLMQCLLKTMGYYDGTIDGDFGDKSDKALRAYQTDEKSKGNYTGEVDGSAGPATWKLLIGF